MKPAPDLTLKSSSVLYNVPTHVAILLCDNTGHCNLVLICIIYNKLITHAVHHPPHQHWYCTQIQNRRTTHDPSPL